MVTIPATNSRGVTRQDETVVLAQELADNLGEVLDVLPFDGVVDEAVNLWRVPQDQYLSYGQCFPGDSWSGGCC